MTRPRRTLLEWNRFAAQKLDRILVRCLKYPALRRRGPRTSGWLIQVRLVGEKKMQALNWGYLKKEYATDVLSFPAPRIFFEVGMLGEIIICRPVMARQAGKLGHSLENELDLLLVHGVLHLLGFDHERGGRARAEMAGWETKLLKNISGLIGRNKLMRKFLCSGRRKHGH